MGSVVSLLNGLLRGPTHHSPLLSGSLERCSLVFHRRCWWCRPVGSPPERRPWRRCQKTPEPSSWRATGLKRAYFAHSIIGQFDVSVVVQQHVVQLQVPVDDPLLMQEVQSDADFSRIKSEKEECGEITDLPVQRMEGPDRAQAPTKHVHLGHVRCRPVFSFVLRVGPGSYLACSSGSFRCRCI